MKKTTISGRVLVATVGIILVAATAKADLVARYGFDDGTAGDSSGNGHDGEVVGFSDEIDIIADNGGDGKEPSSGVLWMDGVPGTYVDAGTFDPTNDGGPFSATAWIKWADEPPSSNMVVVAKFNSWNDDDMMWDWATSTTWPNTMFIDSPSGPFVMTDTDTIPWATWAHVSVTYNGMDTATLYIDGQESASGEFFVGSDPTAIVTIGAKVTSSHTFAGLIDDVRLYDEELGESAIQAIMADQGFGATPLKAGDADMDFDFDQLDLVQVQIAAKYLTGQAATWGDGDWNGAPGGEPGNPPTGNGRFDQLDIIAALAPGHYLTGPYAAVQSHPAGDGGATLVYDPNSGRVEVQAGATQLTSINIDSAAGIFTGEAAQNLGGSFDNDADGNIFKATFGSSFGSLSFGNVAQMGLSEQFVLGDLTVVGSLAGGGDLGGVDLIYVPEPSVILLALLSLAAFVAPRMRRQRRS